MIHQSHNADTQAVSVVEASTGLLPVPQGQLLSRKWNVGQVTSPVSKEIALAASFIFKFPSRLG
eukprot:11083051-Karenia_brevis.AAC.1